MKKIWIALGAMGVLLSSLQADTIQNRILVVAQLPLELNCQKFITKIYTIKPNGDRRLSKTIILSGGRDIKQHTFRSMGQEFLHDSQYGGLTFQHTCITNERGYAGGNVAYTAVEKFSQKTLRKRKQFKLRVPTSRARFRESEVGTQRTKHRRLEQRHRSNGRGLR